jgi:hypothetical protein
VVVCQVVVNRLVSVRELSLEKQREADENDDEGEIGGKGRGCFVVAWQKLKMAGKFQTQPSQVVLLCNGVVNFRRCPAPLGPLNVGKKRRSFAKKRRCSMVFLRLEEPVNNVKVLRSKVTRASLRGPAKTFEAVERRRNLQVG